MIVQPSGTSPLALPFLSSESPTGLNPSGPYLDSRARHRGHHVPIPGWGPMSTRSRARMVATVLILSAASLPMTAQAVDSTTALVAQHRPAGAPQAEGGIRSMRVMAESPTSTVFTQPVTQECDGQAPPAGVLTKLLNRITGHTLPEDVRLCAPPPDDDTATGHRE